ncbi:hypothetical protein [Diaminobutyricimonas sp. LJ205]|uniref:hypothetical protein n=1 Tax=Diaminobutyricimonas sp. LJ205 TaxID=2683590 RepID=UPI0012F4ED5E|nr:hypothetical protein [Diaminobutyricimonas sp. LJ205]
MVTSDQLGSILELFTWIGFGVAVLCAFAILLWRSAEGDYEKTEAIVVAEDDGLVARWMTDDAVEHRPLDPHEIDEIKGKDKIQVYYSRRVPGRMRLHPRSAGEKILGLLLAITAAVGVLAAVISVALLLIES